MFKVGTEFRYKVTRTQDGRPMEMPYEETYRIISVKGESVTVERSSEIEETQILETDTSCGSYIFRTDGYNVVSSTPTQIELEGCLIYADTLSPGNLCGGGVSLLLGRDGIAYRIEENQMWSKGIIYKGVRKLLSISVDGRIYDDIRWVDEGESPDEEEQPGISGEPCNVSKGRFLL